MLCSLHVNKNIYIWCTGKVTFLCPKSRVQCLAHPPTSESLWRLTGFSTMASARAWSLKGSLEGQAEETAGKKMKGSQRPMRSPTSSAQKHIGQRGRRILKVIRNAPDTEAPHLTHKRILMSFSFFLRFFRMWEAQEKHY